MVLSDDALWQIIDAVPGCEERGDGGAWLVRVLRAVEAEVHKQDTALIRQMLDALDECKDSTQERIDTLTESGIDKHKPRYFRSYVQDLQRATDAITAGRARLEGKP